VNSSELPAGRAAAGRAAVTHMPTPNIAIGHAPTRHADVFATLVEWSGHELRNSLATHSPVRGGKSLLSPWGGPRCVEVYAFFNQATRARACTATNGSVLYSLRDPLRGTGFRRNLVTANASAMGGIREYELQSASKDDVVLKRRRLEVNSDYEKWKELATAKAR